MPLCNIRQFRISSSLEDGRELSPPLQRHVDACPRCSRFLAESETLEDRLLKCSADAGESPAWMHTRIMAEIHASAPGGGQERTLAWLPVAAGMAVLAVLAGLMTLSAPRGENPAQETSTVQLSTPVPPVHPASVPARIEKHAKLALATEFQNIATDISGARKFISASLRNTIPGLGGD